MVLSAMPQSTSATHTRVASWQGSRTKRPQAGQQEEPLYILQLCVLLFQMQVSCQWHHTRGEFICYLQNFSIATLLLSLYLLPLEDSHGIWDVLNTESLQLFTKCCETCRWLGTQANSTRSSQLLAGCRVQAHSVLGKLVGNKHGSGDLKISDFSIS